MTKIDRLKRLLKELRRVVVAYSGGLDSTYLLKMAVDTLGADNVLAVTARSETYPLSEYKDAVKAAAKIDVRHQTIATKELEIRNFKSNPVNRCYYCKKELFKKLNQIRKKQKMDYVVDGTNLDDLKDIRHGMKAAKELGVRSPLLEAHIGRKDIRKFSRRLNLPTWDKPSFACLASRFPFYDRITKTGLIKIDKAENFLKKLGFRQARVRFHNNIARIELLKKDIKKAVIVGDIITTKMRQLGFVYITLDLAGYRTGSMHEAV